MKMKFLLVICLCLFLFSDAKLLKKRNSLKEKPTPEVKETETEKETKSEENKTRPEEEPEQTLEKSEDDKPSANDTSLEAFSFAETSTEPEESEDDLHSPLEKKTEIIKGFTRNGKRRGAIYEKHEEAKDKFKLDLSEVDSEDSDDDNSSSVEDPSELSDASSFIEASQSIDEEISELKPKHKKKEKEKHSQKKHSYYFDLPKRNEIISERAKKQKQSRNHEPLEEETIIEESVD